MKKKRSKLISMLLTLVMTLSLVPAMGVTASAADDFVEVSTYEELKNAVDKGDAKVKLMANIDTTNENGGAGVTDQTALAFKGDGNILDLNGYTLKLVSNTGATFFTVLKSLTIKDGGTGGRIDFEYGSSVIYKTTAIYVAPSAGAKLTVESGTLSSTYRAVTIIESEGNLTIKGGKIQVPDADSSDDDNAQAIYTANSYGDKCKILISGGEINGKVMFTRDDSAVAQIPKGSECPIQISGGTFKRSVRPIWQKGKGPSAERVTEYSPVMEISGGTFEGRFADRFRGNLPVKLTGGTFKRTSDFYMLEVGFKRGKEYLAFAESLGNSIIMRGNEIRTACYRSSSDWFYLDSWISLTATKSDPITVIPNAWGMKSVKLDGKEIDYFKDWKGTVERMDNSKDHTIKFEWNPLASELVNTGYSYRVTCDRYISGNKTPTTDTISTTATEYSFTIPAGADPKVYSFDLHLNLEKDGSFVGIFSNEHIVKLVVNEAPVVTPDPTIEGNVYYTSGIVFDHLISTGTGNLPDDLNTDKLRYQWQRSKDGGSTWKDIDGATRGSYTPVKADMGDTVRIRVVVTAEDYLGEIVGMAVKVSKAANNEYPDVIQLKAVQDYTGFEITNFDSDCEYVYSESSTPKWDENQIDPDTATVTGLTKEKTYYVFARFKETATHTAGSIVSRNSINLFDKVPLQYVSLEGYDSGNTIYIKKGESVELKVSADPSNANSWNEITFKDEGATTSNIKIDDAKINASGEDAAAFPKHSITITGVSKGSANLKASYPGTNNYYGSWTVVVYDDSNVTDALRLESVYAYEDITLSENDMAELPDELPKLLPEDSGYHLEWRILKKGTYGATYVTENDNIKLEDGKIKPIKAHAESEKTQLDLVAVKDGSTEYKTLPKKSLFYVTVTEAPLVALTDVTVAPTKVNLEIGEKIQLSAVKQPANAQGDLSWASDKSAVAAVNDTGEVTAKAEGTAKITVTCGEKSATCTVMVGHKHDTDKQNWVYMDPGTHTKTCTANDETKYGAHTFGEWKLDQNDDSKHFKVCSVCNGKVEASHVESSKITDTPAGIGKMGAWHTKCVDCGKKMNTGTFPALTAISAVNVTVSAPIKDAVPGTATTMDTTYDVAATDWEPLVSGTFASGTEYTVKVSLEATGNNRFTDKTTFQINGQKATIVGTQPTATGVEDTKITLTFPATAGGSTSGGSSGGGGGGVTKYAVAVSPADNGKVTSDKTRAAKDSVVTITTKTNDGYALDTIKATDKAGKEIKLTDKGDGKYTFTMPASKVEVKAAFKQTASKPGKPAEEMKTVVVMQVGSKTMFVNGKAYEKDAAPVIMNDRTLVPIRFVTESLGGTVAWNAETKEVTLVIDGKEIKMTIGKTIEKYGVAPVIIDSRTFVPVRFVADELGATTAWNAETKTVTITKAVTPVKTEK